MPQGRFSHPGALAMAPFLPHAAHPLLLRLGYENKQVCTPPSPKPSSLRKGKSSEWSTLRCSSFSLFWDLKSKFFLWGKMLEKCLSQQTHIIQRCFPSNNKHMYTELRTETIFMQPFFKKINSSLCLNSGKKEKESLFCTWS